MIQFVQLTVEISDGGWKSSSEPFHEGLCNVPGLPLAALFIHLCSLRPMKSQQCKKCHALIGFLHPCPYFTQTLPLSRGYYDRLKSKMQYDR
jgi:hypothetical protein